MKKYGRPAIGSSGSLAMLARFQIGKEDIEMPNGYPRTTTSTPAPTLSRIATILLMG
jgi:hypothetical protein